MTRILIVDDDLNLRTIAKQTFLNEGYEVEEAIDGKEAIKIYKEFKPDVVTMDLLMPGVSGFAAIKKIKAYDPEARIIVLTAFLEEDADSIKDLGKVVYLSKPYKTTQLVKSVKKVLEKE